MAKIDPSSDNRENVNAPGSSSLENPNYWWYEARAELLHVALGNYLGTPGRVLDVGSADGPSVDWMRGHGHHVDLDINPRGLTPGNGVCGSAVALPFANNTFDVLAAFDVLEHCEPEHQAMAEMVRVVRPGGRLLLSVPAYQWAWSDHDVKAGHHRRYTRRRLRAAALEAGLDIQRVTYGFTTVFPFFVAERLMRKARTSTQSDQLTPIPGPIHKLLLAACKLDRLLLGRMNLPFGSSIFLAGVKLDHSAQAHPPR